MEIQQIQIGGLGSARQEDIEARQKIRLGRADAFIGGKQQALVRCDIGPAQQQGGGRGVRGARRRRLPRLSGDSEERRRLAGQHRQGVFQHRAALRHIGGGGLGVGQLHLGALDVDRRRYILVQALLRQFQG